MKHFRFALCFLAASSVALLLIAFGRQTVDPTQGQRPSVPVSQVAPDSSPSTAAAATSSDQAAASSEERRQSSTPALSAPASFPANGDDEPRHPGDRVDAATIARRYGNQPLTTTHPAVAAVMDVQERNNRWLLANPAVVGTAVGLNDQADVAIIVYTKVDAPELPTAIEGVPVAVWRSGEFTARFRTQEEAAKVKDDGNARAKGNAGKPGSGTTVDPRLEFPRPVPIGVSTGHPDITAGTIGCRVKSGESFFALSNNHVYANENDAGIGNNVLQPGRYDGGTNPEDAIGTLADFGSIVFSSSASNTIDAAIALTSDEKVGHSTPEGAGSYGRPRTEILAAALSAKVMKYGRTTKHTNGSINGLNATILVGYDAGTAKFVGQIVIGGPKFSAGGDSGSLIVDNNTTTDRRKPVGLLFAGGSTSTIANPIGLVLAEFGVVIDGD